MSEQSSEQLELTETVEAQYHNDEAGPAQQDDTFTPELYKKFFRTKDTGGFLSVRPWWQAGRVSIDIGALKPTGGLASHTEVWSPVVDLAVYLAAIRDGRGPALYPAVARQKLTPESYVRYGAKGTMSRVLRIQYWSEADIESFAWQTGHFQGRATPSGAVIPNFDQPISINKIRMTRLEMADLSYRLDVAVNAYAARTAEWVSHFNGKRPKDN